MRLTRVITVFLILPLLCCGAEGHVCAEPAAYSGLTAHSLFVSEASQDADGRQHTKAAPDKKSATHDPFDTILPVDAAARFLAGMPVPEASRYSVYTKKTAWRKYAAAADHRWASFNKNKARVIKKWSGRELANVAQNCRTLLYPFSGPDFLYAFTFFPDADRYVLIGLEPTGLAPDPAAMCSRDMSACLQQLDESLHDIVQLSFFKTNDMSEELNGHCINGTLPLIMVFLARTGNSILSLRYFDITAGGEAVYRSGAGQCRGRKGFCRGIEIDFAASGNGRIKKLVYLSADISDNGFSQCPGCKMFLERLDTPVVSFLKSASYLMHKSYFSDIRNLVLRKSTAILQDDSAIPFKYFNSSSWDITLYGSYTEPIAMFKEHYEKDLAAAYTRQVKKINFRFGYAQRSNLQLAQKKQAQ